MTSVGLYAKAAAGAVVAGFGAYVSAVQDGPGVTGSETLGIIVAFLIGLGAVWLTPNLPAGVARYLKAGIGAAVAFLSAVAVGWLDGSVSPAEWGAAITALFGALGLVAVTPNARVSDKYRLNEPRF